MHTKHKNHFNVGAIDVVVVVVVATFCENSITKFTSFNE